MVFDSKKKNISMEDILLIILFLLVSLAIIGLFVYFLWILIKSFFNKIKNLCELYSCWLNKKNIKKAQKMMDITTKPASAEKTVYKDTTPTKEEIIASANKSINDVDMMLKEYRVDYLKVVSRDTDTTTEYVLTGINGALNRDFSWRFVLGVSDCDKKKSKLYIMFKNQVGKTNPISLEIISFEHSLENFELLDEPVKVWKNNQYEYTFAVSKTNKITTENFNGEVPYWKKTHIYSFPSSFPNKEISTFYKFFKQEFFNGNYVDLNGNNNYVFCLMFDILKGSKETIQKYLPMLAEKYPVTSPYVKSELVARGICTKTYNGRVYYLEHFGNGYPDNVYCVKENFWRKEQIIHWLTKTAEFSTTGMVALVNENGIIDVIADESLKLCGNEKRCCKVVPVADKLPEYIRFGTVEGNFYYMNTGWNSVKNKESGYKGGLIEPHTITTLEGCPDVVTETFRCEDIGLTSLIGGPKKVGGDYIAKNNSITTLEGVALEIGGDFDISKNELTDEVWKTYLVKLAAIS